MVFVIQHTQNRDAEAVQIKLDELIRATKVAHNALLDIENLTEQEQDYLNWGYIQLGLIAIAFGGLQVWWISNVFWRRNLARPQRGGEFRKSLERIWRK